MPNPTPAVRRVPVVANFGGGVDSTAMILGAMDRGWPAPTAVLFADTMGEKDETYAHVAEFSAVLISRGWPEVTVIRNTERPDGTTGPHESLEQECLTNETLPGLAFGHRGCSVKWKIQPMDRWISAQPWAIEAWERGEKITRWIGYDAGESSRSVEDSKRYEYRFPLREWSWSRRDCIDTIKAAGLAVPVKSACFFCPGSRKHEVIRLARERPDLFERAVAIERAAMPSLCSMAGLGRRYSWERLAKADAEQMRLFPEAPEMSCTGGCGDDYAPDEVEPHA